MWGKSIQGHEAREPKNIKCVQWTQRHFTAVLRTSPCPTIYGHCATQQCIVQKGGGGGACRSELNTNTLVVSIFIYRFYTKCPLKKWHRKNLVQRQILWYETLKLTDFWIVFYFSLHQRGKKRKGIIKTCGWSNSRQKEKKSCRMKKENYMIKKECRKRERGGLYNTVQSIVNSCNL